MTMKHWRAWGTVPNQCWLKAVSSLPKKEKAENKVPSTMGRNRENKKENQKGACQQPWLFLFPGHTSGNAYSFYMSLFFTIFIFFKTAIWWTRDAHIFTGRRATFVQFLLPRCGSSFPESAKRASRHLQGPEPWDYFSSTCRAGRRICCICASKIQPTLVVLLSWQTVHKKQTWFSLCDGKVW